MRAAAVGIGASAGIGALGTTATPAAAVDWSDVGTIAASTLVGGPVGLGWALRQTEVLGSNPPADGLTASALRKEVKQTAQTRKSTNASTIVDNRNILSGVENNAYTQAKIKAIEKLNDGATQSEVANAATTAIDEYQTTIENNLLKTWNESVNEIETLVSALSSHPNLSPSDVVSPNPPSDSHSPNGTQFDTATTTLTDGTSLDVRRLALGSDINSAWDPINANSSYDWEYRVLTDDGSDTDFSYMRSTDWMPIWSEIQTTFQNVRDGISTWVNSVYGDVQSGEIEISSLITPSVRAEILSSEETEASAIADLAALNIPFDPENEVYITVPSTGATLSGTLGLTDSSDGPIVAGNTYDPSTFAGDVYLTTDISQISGSWSAFDASVDGGTITLTSQPYEGTVVTINTTAGESVSVPATDWTDNGDGTYSYDASGDLETTITEVDSASYESADSETQYETIRISKEFTVDRFVNNETGEEVSQATFESSEPQDDTNYITQEEWDQLEQQNQELIEKYEESQNTGAGGGGGFLSGSDQNWGLIAAAAGAVALGWGFITEDSS